MDVPLLDDDPNMEFVLVAPAGAGAEDPNMDVDVEGPLDDIAEPKMDVPAGGAADDAVVAGCCPKIEVVVSVGAGAAAG